MLAVRRTAGNCLCDVLENLKDPDEAVSFRRFVPSQNFEKVGREDTVRCSGKNERSLADLDDATWRGEDRAHRAQQVAQLYAFSRMGANYP